MKILSTLFIFCCALGYTQSLQNQSLQLELAVTPGGAPHIHRAVSLQDGQVIFEHRSPYFFMDDWGPQELIASAKKTAWEMGSDHLFERAHFSVDLENGLRRAHVVELAKQGTLFRIYVTLENAGADSIRVDWYPVWKTTWDIPGGQWMKSWDALTYKPFQNRLNVDAQTVLGSRVHSSDRLPDGHVPYWIIGGERQWLNFSLEWCGGWRAELAKNDFGVEWSVWLPQEETQLFLGPGEMVTGPVITIVPTSEKSEMAHRAEWVRQRTELARKRFGGPKHEYMLVWNHWYSIEFDVNRTYLLNQLPLLHNFGFEAFVIDAGWYTQVGDWRVDAEKFQSPAQLKTLLNTLKAKDMYAGLWSCPQFGRPDQTGASEIFEEPKFYRPFLSGARLYDLYGMNFEQFLVDHVKLLVNEYGANWWKYDQDFFARHSKHGLLKNVEEFQRGLVAVRNQFQDLYIENCQSGGRAE
ncbi:alpha-galactosidase [candidate division KSB1 bacterium]|nr:alpha-galactosidase [candidate division KSB1 bacterium]